ncbi:hypothetical protein GCM10009789_12640 [Kribbella sancticallisti]|uniref:Uncharacterized protein n=1 Tax=Kribbella sancticallisti TaxID=460087 RepID=A0ABN2CQ94_9ACTN
MLPARVEQRDAVWSQPEVAVEKVRLTVRDAQALAAWSDLEKVGLCSHGAPDREKVSKPHGADQVGSALRAQGSARWPPVASAPCEAEDETAE